MSSAALVGAPYNNKKNDLGRAFNKFHLFSKLPLELRLEIWRLAVVPRLLLNKSTTGRKVPGVHHACAESRRECRYVFYKDEPEAGLMINYEHDVLFYRKSDTWGDFDFPFLEESSSHRNLLLPLQHLAILWHEAEVFDVEGRDHCSWLTLRGMCPNLVNLMIMIRQGPLGSDFEDIWEASTREDLVTCTPDYHAGICTHFEVVHNGVWKDVKLSFTRNESWTR